MWHDYIQKIKSFLGRRSSNEKSQGQEIRYLPDFTDREKEIIKKAAPYTMTSEERMVSLCRAMDYVIKNNIEGDLVECGVWRGGSSMIMAMKLLEYGIRDRKIYLYDTFEGMTPPSDVDESFQGEKAIEILKQRVKTKADPYWAYATLDDVKLNLQRTGIPTEQLCFVQGKVEETLPAVLPDKIALLRLDTDWYESTYHELVHLYPKLVRGGILIIDDYGHWKGARRAVEQYLQENGIKIFLSRIDYTGRIAVKL
ncbi:TylF/MycF/NovP-related O-methyltransferase [Thermonema rossianum]|uniref:TylF/MycF/NovP-related O-methyltransferase n=1 Tax=Thermonema rossianum TaxID=55505 RepID=UPI0006923108|nr:TylF/MycF/NovP-related O-methyltransferase [Thermonema rossianum]